MAGAYDSRTALVIIDIQNDFASPEGSLYVPGAKQVVAEVNRQIAEASAAEAHVLYTQDWHPEHPPHFQSEAGIWAVHCVGETWGAAFHPELTVDGEVVRKGTGTEDGYSGFTVRNHESGEQSATLLEGLLNDRGLNASSWSGSRRTTA